MRNKNSNTQVIKRKLDKCKGICRTYNDIQYQYANLLEQDESVVEFIPLDTLVSGSPIIQNGKLIGAVTHVFVKDPTKGYAIFAENMLETAQGVANEGLKDVS